MISRLLLTFILLTAYSDDPSHRELQETFEPKCELSLSPILKASSCSSALEKSVSQLNTPPSSSVAHLMNEPAVGPYNHGTSEVTIATVSTLAERLDIPETKRNEFVKAV